jgi:hypothetical protein
MTSGRCGQQHLAQAEARVIRMASLATAGVFHGAEREIVETRLQLPAISTSQPSTAYSKQGTTIVE